MNEALHSIAYKDSQGFVTGHFTAMAGPCEVIIETSDQELAEKVTKAIADEAWRIESTFSRYRADNIIYRINNADGEPVEVDAETARLLDFADLCFEVSDGMFDITSGLLGKIWKFDGSSNIPDQKDIDRLLPKIGWEKVSWSNPMLQMPAGMALDFGGIGKEYAVDSAAQLARQITELPILINFGGDIVATAPPASRQHWLIGIEPLALGQNSVPPQVALKHGGVATSGDSKRFLQHKGRVLSHVLNPKTGWPVADAPASVTVLANNCTQAGMLSTLAMLQGPGAEEFLATQEVEHWIQRR
ncbi:FAD:protein FMN transferase [Kangiella koreensis]|uniref:FAD:protein FMN transferase n=1 Tax=Kangiella koreensis (strain DSM 16069 / JCM 12317 / KCTC 12182 / SW-125) TaxID=523791 RepID=C7R7D3_KANKD|nr:FAD:protein FMN transferase [Kangiella koreensis]ACV25682.1 ApbE family lipoprotein [Kangiella koreensis DSM 16069]